jgi:tRNA threonylcarbamoyladenosine biosynthesis protein TsaB
MSPSSSPPPAEPSGPRTAVIDTASRTQGLALAHGDWAVAVTVCRTRRGRTLSLLSTLEQMLEQQGWSVRELDGLGVVIGPGSFTGLRVGIATAQGLARAAGLPVFGYNSLQVRALALAGSADPVMPVLDARMGEIYGAVYAGERPLVPPCTAEPGAFAATVAAAVPEGPVRACGAGARLYREGLEAVLGERLVLASGPGDHPGIAALAVEVAARVARGDVPREDELTPLYQRASQAEAGRG